MKKGVRSESHRKVAVMSAVLTTELKLLLMMLWLTTASKLFLSPTGLHSVVTDAMERFAVPADPVPGDPYDIFLRRKEHRVFRKRGSKSTTISISKQPEYVYYNPLRSCIPGKGNIWAEVSTKLRFNEKHKELLWREFGLQL